MYAAYVYAGTLLKESYICHRWKKVATNLHLKSFLSLQAQLENNKSQR